MKTKKIGEEQYVLVFCSSQDAKKAQDETGCFTQEILNEISGKVRDDFDSFRVGKKIYIW